ncbi:phage integrase SAM-like domain-containing protein [Pedobacter caeni]|uniref:Phage integrase SAM-like domain-containing protein n=1 Tax=Pedobacter caeni TaxID=288992 RepID=A0A1M4UHB2_9SPHI|nr:phage integrase SAM-like domain-containing protein [Pedobacter caeni]SHE56087.1 hypothetical protein SAMN04488522_101560 [Pedobacter caeni]
MQNAYLDQLQTFVYDAHQSLIKVGETITADAIKNRYLGKGEKSHTLMEAVRDHNEKMKALVGKEFVHGTLNRYKVLEKHLENFIRLKYNMTDMDIRHINQSFISDFDFYLRSDKSCANSYVVKDIKNLGKIIHICLANGWIVTDVLIRERYCLFQAIRK